MGTTPFLDFQAILLSYSVEELMAMTGLPFKKDGKSYRCECPIHKGGRRSLVVTPDEADEKGNPGVFYCFGEKVGGDRVAMLAHVRDAKPYGIFKELAAGRPQTKQEAAKPPAPVPEEKEKEGGVERGFKPLPYLDYESPTVLALGIPPEILAATGTGFAPRGLHRGRVAIPLRLADGAIVGYISIEATTSVQLPPKWNI